MTKEQLVKRIAANTNRTIKETREDFDIAIKTFIEAVQEENIVIAGFGTFSMAENNEKDLKSPLTGEIVHVPAKRKIKFKLSKTLKDSLN